MSKFKAVATGVIVLGLAAGLVIERQVQAALRNDIWSLRSQMQQLAERIALLQQERTNAVEPPQQVAVLPEQTTELNRLREEINQLRQNMLELERANVGISNQLAAAKGPEIPFVYPDATKRKDYSFTGYTTPQSAFQSVLWAITQLDPKAFQASITGTMSNAFASEFEELPEGVMPGGFKNGAMFQASGYRILEETPLSEEEFGLKVFLEGPRVVIKPVLKNVGGEWKWERNGF